MPKFFISHSTVDRQFIENDLNNLLKALGFEVWYSQEGITTSQQWERSIRNGLETSEWFILIMSKASSKSEWVKNELNWAIEERRGHIIPILIEDCKPIDFHIELIRIQYIDFRNNLDVARNKLTQLLVESEYKPHLNKIDLSHPLLKQSRNFWNQFSDSKTQIVVGRHSKFNSFEPSGLLGVGDAIGMTELLGHLQSIGMHNISIQFADRLDGDDLKTHLVLLGGPDGNSVVNEAYSRLETKLLFGDPEKHEISFYDSIGKLIYIPVQNHLGKVEKDYAVIFKTVNPFCPQKQLLIVAGSFGYGTWAGVRYLMSDGFLKNEFVEQNIPFECLVRTDVYRETPQKIDSIFIRKLSSET